MVGELSPYFRDTMIPMTMALKRATIMTTQAQAGTSPSPDSMDVTSTIVLKASTFPL